MTMGRKMDAAWKKAISDAKKGASKLGKKIGNMELREPDYIPTPAKKAGGNTGMEIKRYRLKDLPPAIKQEAKTMLKENKLNQKAVTARDNIIGKAGYHIRKTKKLGLAATIKSAKKTNWD